MRQRGRGRPLAAPAVPDLGVQAVQEAVGRGQGGPQVRSHTQGEEEAQEGEWISSVHIKYLKATPHYGLCTSMRKWLGAP